MFRAALAWLMVVAVQPIFAAENQPAVDAAWRERMNIDGAAAYDAFKALAPFLETESEVRFLIPANAKGMTRSDLRTRRDQTSRFGTNTLSVRTTFSDGSLKPEQVTVTGENDRYSFVLRKRKDASGWLVEKCDLGRDNNPTVGESAHTLASSAYLDLLDALAAAGTVRLDWHKSAPPRLTRLQWDAATERLIVEYSAGEPANRIDCRTLVEPLAAWRVIEHVSKSRLGRTTRTFEYGEPIRGVQFPRLETTANEYSSEPPILPNSTSRAELLNVRFTNKLPADFYLTAFGLPEPPGITPPARPTPTYVWLLLAAAILGFIAVGCRWLLKRKAKVVLPPVPPTPTA